MHQTLCCLMITGLYHPPGRPHFCRSRAMDETTPEHFVMVPLVDVLGGPYRTEDAFKTAARPIEDLINVELGTLKPDGLSGRLEILRIAARRRRKRLSDSRV